MRAALFGVGWVALGVLLIRRQNCPLGWFDRILFCLFWPFFLGDSEGRQPQAPLVRLALALEPDDPAEELVHALRVAVDQLQHRLQRVERALMELGGGQASRDSCSYGLLLEAREQTRAELTQTLQVVDEAATRLVLAREEDERAQVAQLLAELRARLEAGEELRLAT
jgi:hypothetical protein